MLGVRVTVVSSLPREDCARRLREAIDGDMVIFGKKPVIGRVGDAQLRLRKRIKGKNSFQTFLRARVFRDPGGTRFECRFGMHPAVIAFMAFWFGAVLTIGAAAAIEVSGIAAAMSVAEPIVLLAPLAMVAFGIGLVSLGRYSSREHQRFLTDFLCATVQGKVQAPSVITPVRQVRVLIVPAALLLTGSALSAGQSQTGEDLAALRAEFRRPVGAPPQPADNPSTIAKVRLGWALFQDRRLSGDQSLACVDCHQPERDWQDGRPRAQGVGGHALQRRTLSLFDVAWGETFFWDGRARSLEDQSLVPIEASNEMNLRMADAVDRLRPVGFYQGMFAEAFSDDPHVSERNVTRAIAAFERTIVSGTTPFDRWVEGAEDALDPAAKRGFALFAGKANCAACHLGWRLTDDGFHDTGLPGTDDPGRGPVVSTPMLNNSFKTPGLRNVARRPPYMHDGALPTLRAVVDHYADGIVERPTLSDDLKRIALTPEERADLVAFLEALTDDKDPTVRWSPFD
jgi:cytochrome c peroxidase